MSYILEALQRADRERKQAQPVSMASVVDGTLQAQITKKKGWKAGWGLAAAVVLSWLLWGNFRSETAVSPAPSTVNHPPVVMPSPTASSESKKMIANNHSSQISRPLPTATLPSQSTEPLITEEPLATVDDSHPKKSIPSAIQSDRKASPPAKASPVILAQLPFQIRNQLPDIRISALINHPNPARRVAWINDRSLHIGQWVTQTVRLIAIEEDHVTLAFHGYQIVMTPFDHGSALRR